MKIVIYGPRATELEQVLRSAYSGPYVDIQNQNIRNPGDMDFCLGSLSFPKDEQCIILVQVSVLGEEFATARRRLQEMRRDIPLESKQLGTEVYVLHDDERPGEFELAGILARETMLSVPRVLSNPKLQLPL